MLNTRNSNAATGQSLPSSPFAGTTRASISQSSPSQSPSKPGQVERSVLFTATERILMTQADDQVISSEKQKLISPAPTKVLLWMLLGMAT